MKKTTLTLTIATILLVLTGSAVLLYRSTHQPQAAHKTITPVVATIVKKVVATGKVIPRHEVELKSQISGIVAALYVRPGQMVQRGQPIARIAPRPNMLDVNTAEAELKAAEASFQQASIDLERMQMLFAQRLISQAELDQAKLATKLQQHAVDAARNALLLLRKGASADARFVSNLIPATLNGMVLDVANKEGSFVVETSQYQSGSTIAVIADMNDMIFEGFVDESEVGKLQTGMPMLLHVAALDEQPYQATLEYVAPKGVMDQGAMKFTIRAAVKLNPALFLRANYSANADIVLAQRDNVLSIDEGALITENGAVFVDVQTRPGQYARRRIKTGLSDGINSEVIDGLSAAERVLHHP